LSEEIKGQSHVEFSDTLHALLWTLMQIDWLSRSLRGDSVSMWSPR